MQSNLGTINGENILSISGALAFTEKGNTYNIITDRIMGMKKTSKKTSPKKQKEQVKVTEIKTTVVQKEPQKIILPKKPKPVEEKKVTIKDEENLFMANMKQSGIDKI